MQPTQDFNETNLLWMRGRGSNLKLKENRRPTQDEWHSLAKRIEGQVSTGAFQFKGIYSTTKNNKRVLSTNNAADTLVLRKLNDNIRRAYGIRQTQRAQAIKLAKKALSEYTPKGIVRIDLKSCFESITPQKVIEKLRRDGRVSYQTIHLLELFFRQSKAFGSNRYTKGLPRGVVFSSTLAELYLKELDKSAFLIDGLYIYVRYVDDILAIAAKPGIALHGELERSAKNLGLRLNTSKTEIKHSGCACAFACVHAAGKCSCQHKCACSNGSHNLECVEYLGYKLIFATGKSLVKQGACYALLSRKKMATTKLRVCNALNDYRKTRNFSLLHDRLRFLTSNVAIDHSLRGRRLLTGLAFTHDQYSEPPTPHPFVDSTIPSLDTFLRTKIRRLAKHYALSTAERNLLIRRSFSAGHKHRHRANFHPSKIREITGCWSHA